ncbi:MAG: hypothetical protein U0872_16550 [Planctomycetaceae bacterium]
MSRDLPLTGVLVSPLSAAKRIELQHRLEEVRRRIVEVDLDLQRLGFDPPGTDLEAWLHLARIIEVDPSQMTAAELYQEALAWVDRTRIQEQIRQRLRRKQTGRKHPPSSATTQRESRENTGFGFVGHRDWENWGLGLDLNQGWHLYHFQRRDGQWRRHQHCALRIPGGLPGSLAQAFVTGRGALTEGVARSLWKKHSRNPTPGSTVDKVKSALSRLRPAIVQATEKEGHHPDGNPFVWQANQMTWQSLLKFGYATRGQRQGYRFQPAE